MGMYRSQHPDDASGRGAAGDRETTPAAPSKIQHTKPGIIMPSGPGSMPSGPTSARTMNENRPLPVADSASPIAGSASKITMFGKERRHEDNWTRTPNTTGSGAIHVKTFHCKLTEDAIMYMDQTINEWLDAHPQYEVKFVSSTIGTMTGKLKEPALFCQVWV